MESILIMFSDFLYLINFKGICYKILGKYMPSFGFTSTWAYSSVAAPAIQHV